MNDPSRQGFTLAELLITISIIAILVAVTIITINPAQLLAQSRDAKRISDLASLNAAISYYQSDQQANPTFSLGSTTVAYLSVPDPNTTSTTGNACTNLNLPSSAGYAYHCAASTTYLNASSTGWVPVNFQNITAGSPIATVPVDPKNQTSTNLYYTYETNGYQWALSAFFESQKYAKTMQSTGGIDPALYEVGTGITSLPEMGRGLAGYWPLNEGTGLTAVDWSGNGDNQTWSGSQTGTSQHYSPGKASQWAGAFDGSSDILTPATNTYLGANAVTVAAWVKKTIGNFGTAVRANYFYFLDFEYGATTLRFGINGDWSDANSGYADDGNWHFVVGTFNGSVTSRYVDGTLIGQTLESYTLPATTFPYIGSGVNFSAHYFSGEIADVRIYGRVLSQAEIQEIYNAEK
jgi:prepilin-type N-terminal cleavage/methylation domain-containing protein